MFFALALLSASAFKFVSQTFKGELKMKSSDASIPSPTTATVELGLDMESVKFRSNQHMVIEMPQLKMTTSTNMSMIFDAEAKRATVYTHIEIKGSIPIPQPPATCKYFEFPNLPDTDVVAKCLQDIAALAKAEDLEDGLQKFQMKVPVPEADGSATEVVYTDKSFVMKKLIAEVKVQGPHPMTINEEMTDMNSKAGVPDPSQFVVPAGWGTCTKDAIPPMPIVNDPVMKSFLHCMGMGASQAAIVV